MSGLSIVAAADQAGYTVFAAALRSSDLMRVLGERGPFTMFAPCDAAFDKFSRAARDRLLEGDAAMLNAVLGYHFAAGKVTSAQFAGKYINAVTHQGENLSIDGRTKQMRVNKAALIDPDRLASNGIIHGIDGVLWPKVDARAIAGAA